MRTRRTSRASGVAALAVSLRWLAARYALTLLFLVAVLCVAISQTKPDTISNVRNRLTQGMIPLWQTLAAPGDAVAQMGSALRDWKNTYEDNVRLRADNMALRQWQAEAARLAAENTRLQQLVQFNAPAPVRMLTAKVVTDIGGSYQRSLLVLAGTKDNVDNGTVVMGPNGVIGRIVEIGPKAARVLLITDVNARIPARLEQSNATAIVTGNGSTNPHLMYLPHDVTPTVGERVVTSGHGGIYPSGLPIGTVSSVDGDNVTIDPFDEGVTLDIVRLVDYRPAVDITPAVKPAPKKK